MNKLGVIVIDFIICATAKTVAQRPQRWGFKYHVSLKAFMFSFASVPSETARLL